ncbi:cytochrome B [Frigidibacter albus]|uniref:Cytochrome B n=1 Tax=Frigidibacter albus TaxID=1465486 RepID=A0A6L8VDE7_9RHOB|nr:cytochrome b/b6 domain-containing protein [Frigidibacter albus]MZQ88335.1 cytochrome B [Frigidibacter albus]NBE29991.1 cytochrome B [Frigidibacter albus]GGH46003.1 cytochrome b561 [Frigidibacter albus]
MIANTATSYGSLARALHWLTALLILSALGLGLYAGNLPSGSDAEVARLASVFSLHKTIGVAAFFTALVRIVWALVQPRPAPLHPERRAETLAAEVVHWALYGAMLVMPLSGWVYHSAVAGFAPILWPFGQALPLVPLSEAVAGAAKAVHHTSALVLYAAIGLHVLGALKHALIDRDATLARMTRGVAGGIATRHGSLAAPVLALMVWAAVIGFGVFAPAGKPPGAAPAPVASATEAGWTVTEGTLGIALKQMGAEVSGSFTGWTAEIDYDEATRTGAVTVSIPVTGLTLGSVTPQALGPEFFDAETHPTAVFSAQIADEGAGLVATGTLDLRGMTVPATLPFTLGIEGDTATMAGSTTLDRRDFGMGASYGDETTVGFTVQVDVALTAVRAP